jgi:hypothetical protein
MTVKIGGKPTLVKPKEEKEGINWVYLGVVCIGYGFIFWILRLAAHTFLGGM